MWNYYIRNLSDFEYASDRSYYYGPSYGRHGYKSSKRHNGWIIAKSLIPLKAKIDFQKLGFDSHPHGCVAVLEIANQTFEPAGVQLIENENTLLDKYNNFFFSEEKKSKVYTNEIELELYIKYIYELKYFNRGGPLKLTESEGDKFITDEVKTYSALAGNVPVIINCADENTVVIMSTEKYEKNGEIYVLNQNIGSYKIKK